MDVIITDREVKYEDYIRQHTYGCRQDLCKLQLFF
jgi:hypothetical protein